LREPNNLHRALPGRRCKTPVHIVNAIPAQAGIQVLYSWTSQTGPRLPPGWRWSGGGWAIRTRCRRPLQANV